MSTKCEIWKPVPGYEGRYEVSDQGRVRSLDRVVELPAKGGSVRNHRVRGRLLRPGAASSGYLSVAFWAGGKHRTLNVHVLVLEAFVGPRQAGAVARHLDDNKANNTLANLAWGTRRDNRADADRNGRSVRGEGYRSAKLSEFAARVIRRLHRAVPQSELAELFGVSPAAVQAVHDRRTWTHV